MNRFFYEAGRLWGQTRWFASSTPLRFAIACAYLFLLVVLSWAILKNSAGYEFPSPPDFYIPFLGRPSEWAKDYRIGTTWVGLIALISTWFGVVKIAARNQFGSTTSVPAPTPTPFRPPIAEPSKSELPLAFQSGEGAFEYACKYCGCDLEEGENLIAIVLDTRKIVGGDVAVKTLANGHQLAMLKVSSPDGGFVVSAETLSALGPKLEPGDLVSWRIGSYSSHVAELFGDKRAGWVGLIVAKVKPEYSLRDGWLLDGIYQSDSRNQVQKELGGTKQASQNQKDVKRNFAPALTIVAIAVVVGVYVLRSNDQKVERERKAVFLKQQALEQQKIQEKARLLEEENQRTRFSPDVLSDTSEIYKALARATPKIKWSASGKEFWFANPKIDDPLGMLGATYAVQQVAYERAKAPAVGYPRRFLSFQRPPKKLGLDYSCHACKPLIGIFVLSASYGKIDVDANNQFHHSMGGWGTYKDTQEIRLMELADETIWLPEVIGARY